MEPIYRLEIEGRAHENHQGKVEFMSLLIEASGLAWADALASLPKIEFSPARVIWVWSQGKTQPI